MSAHPLVFLPHHSGEKSEEPFFSAMFLNADSAIDAVGNSGALVFIGPNSFITRLIMPLAGRPLKRFVNAVCGILFA